MSGAVVLVLVGVIGIVSATRCNYETGLIDDYLKDKDNLYCFDGDAVELGEFARLCATDSAFATPREDQMSTLCESGYSLVGYTDYPCDTDTGELAAALTTDSILTQYSACVNDTTLVCLGVQTAAATSKLLVDTAYDVDNVDLQAAEDASIVYYSLVCDDGYDYTVDVSGTVYGYCSDNSDENLYTIHADSDSSACFEKCPAEPDSSQIESGPENFVSADIDDAQKSGASISATVTCSDGYEIASSAEDQYTFTCNGVEEGTANGGTYSCDSCPVCVATCPANPTADQLQDVIANLVSLVIEGESSSQLVVAATVVCDAGYSIADDASLTYDFVCNSSSDTEVGAGLYALDGDAPVCKPTCLQNTVVSIEDVTLIDIDGGNYGEVVTGTVHCDSDFSLSYGHDDQYDFVCSDGSDSAEGGVYACVDDCPVCEETCTIPDDDDEFHYALIDEDDNIESAEEIPHGDDHIEISCQNELHNLVGYPYLSCLRVYDTVCVNTTTESFNSTTNITTTLNETECTTSSSLALGTSADDAPFCADTQICESPSVEHAQVSSLNNLEVGGVYTITCDPSYWFDIATATTYAPNSTESHYQIEVECQGEELPAFGCYFGCLIPDFAGGVTSPDVTEDNAAPYAMGVTVTFSCLDGANIEEGAAEATCDVGGIPSPICSACSTSLVFSILTSLLFLLL